MSDVHNAFVTHGSSFVYEIYRSIISFVSWLVEHVCTC